MPSVANSRALCSATGALVVAVLVSFEASFSMMQFYIFWKAKSYLGRMLLVVFQYVRTDN